MGFLQWLTIGFTAFLFLLILTYWLGLSKPGTGKDYRREMLSALVGIEGLLIGVFIQEYRVQDKAKEANQAQQVVADYSTRVAQLQRLAARITPQNVATPQSQAAADSIRAVIGDLRRLETAAPLTRRPNITRVQP